MERLKSLLNRAVDAMERDIERIQHFSTQRKLTPGYARDVRDYVKVLAIVIQLEEKDAKAKKESLSNLSDDELRAKAKELLND